MQEKKQNDSSYLLDEVHHKLLGEYMPLIIFTSTVLFIGILGNILTLRFYYTKARKTSTSIFIISLAGVDLIICCLASFNVAEISINVYLESSYLCKVMYFLNHWTVGLSVFIIWIIAIDRYRKICYPFGWQFNSRTAVKTIISFVVVSLMISTQHLFTMDVVKMKITISKYLDISPAVEEASINTTDHDSVIRGLFISNMSRVLEAKKAIPSEIFVLGGQCTHTDSEYLQIMLTLANGLDAVIICTVLVTFVVTYSHMCVQIRKLRKRNINGHTGIEYKSRTLFSLVNDKIFETSFSCENIFSCNKDITNKNNTDISHHRSILSLSKVKTLEIGLCNAELCQCSKKTNIVVRSATNSTQTGKESLTERNITMMMFTVSTTFVVCFLPYLIITGIRVLDLSREDELKSWVQFLLISPLYNNVINPIIYCFFNPQFRSYVRQLCCQFSCRLLCCPK